MARIIAIANQKGGVGKTTTAINLAGSLAEQGYRVLCVDMDPQANLTVGLGINLRNVERSIADALVDSNVTLDEIIVPTQTPSVDVAPSTIDLSATENVLFSAIGREQALRDVLQSPAAERYDYVLIDCPPTLGLLTLNALVAADAVLIPLHCEYFALEGLADLVGTMRRVRAALNPALDIDGVLLTMFDERTNLGQQVANDVRQFFKEKVFRTVIPRNVRLGEAPSHGMPVILYDVKSRGAEAYLALAREVMERAAATAA